MIFNGNFDNCSRFSGRSKKDSMYKRLSAHLTTTLDLPELPEAIRDTANKVESMVNSARHSNIY